MTGDQRQALLRLRQIAAPSRTAVLLLTAANLLGSVSAVSSQSAVEGTSNWKAARESVLTGRRSESVSVAGAVGSTVLVTIVRTGRQVELDGRVLAKGLGLSSRATYVDREGDARGEGQTDLVYRFGVSPARAGRVLDWWCVVASPNVRNESEVHPVWDDAVGLRFSGVFDCDGHLTRRESPLLGIAGYRLNKLGRFAEDNSGPILLPMLHLAHEDSSGRDEYTAYPYKDQDLVRVGGLIPPTLSARPWSFVRGPLLLLGSGLLLYFAAIFFTTHRVTPLTLLGAVISNAAALVMAWCGLTLLYD
jgi:hypothetical protein